MARPKPFKRRDFDLVSKMDKLAANLIETAEGDKVELSDKLGAFGVVTKWIAVKNRVTEGEGDGSDIGDYKDRINGTDDPRTRISRQNAAAGRKGMASRWHGDSAVGRGGSALDELRSRLPAADDGGAGIDSHAGRSSNDVVRVNAGGHSIGGFGDAGTEQPESGDAGGLRRDGGVAIDVALSEKGLN